MSEQLRLILADIIRGYTHVRSSEYGPFFIKHLNNFDLAEIDYAYSVSLDSAKEKGIPTREEKTKRLTEEGIWTKQEEEKLGSYQDCLSQYEMNRSNEFLMSKRKNWDNQISDLKKDIRKLQIKKSTLLGDVAESFASKSSNEKHISMSFYKDKEFKERLFPDHDFNELSDKQVMGIIGEFKKHNSKFDATTLRKVSILPTYLNMFYMAPESIYEFYGKAIINLTFYQVDVWGNARKFQNDTQEFRNIPKDIQSDPEKLMEYVELNRNYKKAFPDDKDGEGGGGSIVGASKEDLETLGIKSEAHFSFSEELKKKGGKLSKEDLLRLQGDL